MTVSTFRVTAKLHGITCRMTDFLVIVMRT